MTDSFLDLPSSPDPLADDGPKPAHSVTRRTARTTLTPHDFPSQSRPRSTSRRSSPMSKSPRKQMFELDVGNEIAPQKILVTVEAEEALNRGTVNRRLFPPPSPSPTRSPRRREPATTTTTVPLNDDPSMLENAPPRKRGRPRRTSNGTPMPKSRKRAGTPLQKASRQRRRTDEPTSDTGSLDGAPAEVPNDDDEETPRPKKTRVRKTPKKTAATPSVSVPSSQVAGKSTGRKRGRPRKALLPEEVATLASDAGMESGHARTDSHMLEQEPTDAADAMEPARDMDAGEQAEDDNDGGAIASELPPRESSGAPTPTHHEPPQEAEGVPQVSNSATSSPRGVVEEDGYASMSENDAAMEAQSDVESITDGVAYSGQDNLTHASDFSMIAVESLPSFQASYQGNSSRIAEEPEEIGEETSLIINRTLESLRQSTQISNSQLSPQPSAKDGGTLGQEHTDAQDHSTGAISNRSTRALSRSPRRPKQVPLSRQVFAAKAPHVDDSFSSIPDSVLLAATPRRLPMKPTTAVDQDEDDNLYEDSFSEIPEVVLEAATPKPAERMSRHSEGTGAENPGSQPEPGSAPRSAGTNLGSSRLPTPDDTSSSNTGSKQSQEDDVPTGPRPQSSALSPTLRDLPSSPPVMPRAQAMGFGTSGLLQPMGEASTQQYSSPQLSPSTREPSDQPQSPVHSGPGRRPTLSPIVRVGRTLQSVVSDRSSPEGRESSLGSPFRGSISNEPPHQSSASYPRLSSRSPAPSDSKHGNHGVQVGARSSNTIEPHSRSVRFSLSHNSQPAAGEVLGDPEDPFGPDMHDYSYTESLRRAAYNPSSREPGHDQPVNYPSLASSTRAAPPSDDQMSWAGDSDRNSLQTNGQAEVEMLRSQENSGFATRGTDAGQRMSSNAAEMADEMSENQDDEPADEPADDPPSDDNGDMADGLGEDADLWDVEASRSSPQKQAPALVEQPNAPPPRRSKIPSPWRRSSRRLIYKDEVISPSQIEIDESPTESEGPPSVSSRQRMPEPQAQTRVDEELPESDDDAGKTFAPPEQQDSPASDVYNEDAEEHGEPRPPADSFIHRTAAQGIEQHPEGSKNFVEPADATEYSLIPPQSKEDLAPQEKTSAKKSRLFGGFDILSFFSSPATLPPKKAPEPHSETRPAERKHSDERIRQQDVASTLPKVTREDSREQTRTSLWGSGLFPSIPQKEFRPSPERRIDLFSRDSSREPDRAPVLPQKDANVDTYEPSFSASPSPSASPSTPERQMSTPERQVYPSIEQKRNFTPRPGQAVSSLFAPGPTKSPANRGGVDRDSFQPPNFDQEESSLLTEGSEYERVPPREKPSRWDRHLSPVKSAFRSPLKPTTPGRVVAFAGNASSSPLSHVQARSGRQTGFADGQDAREEDMQTALADRQTSLAGRHTGHGGGGGGIRSAKNPPTGPPLQPVLEGKENQVVNSRQTSNHANITANNDNNNTATTSTTTTTTGQAAAHEEETAKPPNNKKAPAAAAAGGWTKQHWARLDELLQLRRRDPLQFRQRWPLPPRNDRRRATTGRLLLGKEVAAQGASVILEGWHLEVIEAFRLDQLSSLSLSSSSKTAGMAGAAAVAPPWLDERALAKRLFALVVGEQRRRRAAGT